MSLAACAPITSGSGFLKSSLAYLDCAGREVGASGYTALTQPGSVISQLILTVITVFIAWHGIRMMFGRMPDTGDAVIAVAKIGLVLMLVTSWPAVRTLFAAPAFAGSAELVAETPIQGPLSLEDRLQRVDDGIVALTKWGTGKLDIRAGRTADGQPAASEFAGVALTDNLALGLGRLSFLVGALMSIGLLKLLTGVMISALPLFAGLLLFDVTRSLFLGWVRILFAMFVASFAVPLILTVELSLIEPWLAGAIAERSAYFATPAAPTELLAMTGSFLLILGAAMALMIKACFSVDIAGAAARAASWRQADAMHQEEPQHASPRLAAASRPAEPTRAESLAWTLSRHASTPAVSTFGAGGTWRAGNDLNEQLHGRDGTSSIRRRAKQRMALSHARRNER
jgi:type IV secretion system protein VirB6